MINVKTDSRKVVIGDIFVAIKGYTVDGHDYIEEAIKNGATKIICEKGNYSVETVVVENSDDWLCNYLSTNYSKIVNKLKIVGVTGTNGKTTTCFLVYNSLKKLKQKCAYIGTIGFYIDDFVKNLDNTTPDVLEIYNLLLEAIENGVKYVIMEVSSHALQLNRVCGIKFDVALFTNLTKDHLDYHKCFENYALAKQKLFKYLKGNKIAIINNDSDYSDYMLLSNNKNITYGFKESDYYIKEFNTNSLGTTFTYIKSNKSYTVSTKLSGKHNVYNMMSNIIILKSLGFDESLVLQIVNVLDSPLGRMQKIIYKTNSIIIDYAHTPDAVENIINSVKEFANGKIYTLVGCGGDRDKTKRPEMAKIATEASDFVYLTSDNPRTEDPVEILNDMTKNLDNKNYTVIVNRKSAIKKAIMGLKENDILLLLGKGHETYQVIGREKITFDEAKIVKDIINKL